MKWRPAGPTPCRPFTPVMAIRNREPPPQPHSRPRNRDIMHTGAYLHTGKKGCMGDSSGCMQSVRKNNNGQHEEPRYRQVLADGWRWAKLNEAEEHTGRGAEPLVCFGRHRMHPLHPMLGRPEGALRPSRQQARHARAAAPHSAAEGSGATAPDQLYRPSRIHWTGSLLEEA